MEQATSYRVVKERVRAVERHAGHCLGYVVLKDGKWHFNPSDRSFSDPRGYPSAEAAVKAHVEEFSLQPQSSFAGWDDTF